MIRRILRRLRRLRGHPAAEKTKHAAPSDAARTDDLHRWLKDALLDGVDMPQGVTAPLPRGKGPLRRAELDRYLTDLEMYLQDLLSPFEPGPQGRELRRFQLQDGVPLELDLDAGWPEPTELSLTAGPAGARFRLAVNGRDWSDPEALLADALQGAETETARALAVYRFVRDHCSHGAPPTDHRDDPLAADPHRFFNGFGLGLCGNAANTFAVLCEWAGLTARVWNVRGHTFPEVDLAGAPAVFDPDLGTYWVDPTRPGRVLGSGQVAKRPGPLLEGLHVDASYEPRRAKMVARLADRDAHRVVAEGADLAAAVAADPGPPVEWCLAADEELSFLFRSRGPWFGTRRLLPAPFSPPAGLARVRLRRVLVRDGVRIGDRGGIWEIDTSLPVPWVDAWLCWDDEPEAPAPELAFDRGDGWQSLVYPPFRTRPDVFGLRRACRGLPPGASVRFRITLPEGRVPRNAELVRLGQMAAGALPAFRPGPNTLVARGEGALSGQLRFDPGDGSTLQPVSPADGAHLGAGEPWVLSWSGAGSTAVDLQISPDPAFREPWSPNFDRRVSGGELVLEERERAFLRGGEAFHWRVRRAPDTGQMPGPWSASRSFSVDQSEAYLRSVERKLDAGREHWTLGSRLRDESWFLESGRATFDLLCKEGLDPQTRCVDYGCGSLRVGRFLIEYLRPGRYLGMDLTERFYREGLAQLDPALVAERQPGFAAIDPDGLSRARAFGPQLVISVGVLLHLSERELPGFFGNLAQLLGATGRAWVTFKEGPALRRTSDLSWAHPRDLVVAEAAEAGLAAELDDLDALEQWTAYEDGKLRLLRLSPQRGHRP